MTHKSLAARPGASIERGPRCRSHRPCLNALRDAHACVVRPKPQTRPSSDRRAFKTRVRTGTAMHYPQAFELDGSQPASCIRPLRGRERSIFMPCFHLVVGRSEAGNSWTSCRAFELSLSRLSSSPRERLTAVAFPASERPATTKKALFGLVVTTRDRRGRHSRGDRGNEEKWASETLGSHALC